MKTPRIAGSQERITPQAIADGARLLPAGALLVVVRGMILAHSFPVAETLVPVAINQDMKALLPHQGVRVGFVRYRLELAVNEMLTRVSEATHGTKRLPQEELLSFSMALPPEQEQEAISLALAAVEDRGVKGLTHLAHLQTLKRGLLQDLLTGRVRVTPD